MYTIMYIIFVDGICVTDFTVYTFVWKWKIFQTTFWCVPVSSDGLGSNLVMTAIYRGNNQASMDVELITILLMQINLSWMQKEIFPLMQ